MKMEKLISSLGESIQQTYNIGQINSLESFLHQYFKVPNVSSEESTYIPKTIKISIPGADDGSSEKVILAPVAALVKHNSLNIDYVKLNLNIEVSEENDDGIEVTSKKTNCAEKASDKTKTGELEIMFKCRDTPEGISRVETHLNNIL